MIQNQNNSFRRKRSDRPKRCNRNNYTCAVVSKANSSVE